MIPPLPLLLVLAPLASGDVSFAKLSPDGEQAAFGERPDSGRWTLFTVPTNGSTLPIAISGPVLGISSGGSVEFTPDGTRVLFAHDGAEFGRYQLFAAPTDGSQPPMLLSPAQPTGRTVSAVGSHWFRFTPDHQQVVFVSNHALSTNEDVWIVPVDGSATPQKLTSGLVQADVQQLELTPDGALALYRTVSAPAGRAQLWSVPLDGSAAPALLSAGIAENVTTAALVPGGSQVVFAAPPGLYVTSSDGVGPPTLLASPGAVSDLVLRPAGVAVYLGGGILRRVPIDASAPETPMTTGGVQSVQYSEDLEWAIFSPPSPFLDALYSLRLDGSDVSHQLLLTPDGVLGFHDLSPDGRSVVYTKGDGSLGLVPVDRSLAPRALFLNHVTRIRFVPGSDSMVLTTRPPLSSESTVWRLTPFTGELAREIGAGDSLDLRADRGKRTVSSFPVRGPSRAGLVLRQVTHEDSTESLFAEPWDGSRPPVLLNP